MSVTEIIRLTKDIYQQINNPGILSEIVAPNLYDIWRSKNKNIIAFQDSLSPDNRDKLWKWLRNVGVDNIDKLNRIYSIMNVVDMKRQQLPSEITSLLPRCENNFAVLIGILGNEYLEIMIDWCGKNISEEDIQNSQTTQNNTDINQQELDLHNLHNLHNLPKIVQLIRQNQPQSAPCYIPGRSFNQIKINSQVTRNPGATNITHNSVTNNIPESSGLKVRSLNQLQKLYDQYH